MAMDAVWAHRFRSLLTILGIVIGITTVVTVSSLLTGCARASWSSSRNSGRTTSLSTKAAATPPWTAAQGAQTPRHQAGVRGVYQALCLSVEDVGLELYIPAAMDGKR